MPAKRCIILDRTLENASWYRYVLWADVPAGNQIAYRNPAALSAYENATPAELQAIRDGLVAEKVGTYQHDSASLTTMQSWLESQWSAFQTEITSQAPWIHYNRHWDGAAWQASAGVPMAALREVPDGVPAYIAITPVSGFAANKFHFVLFNGAAAATGQSCIVKIRLLAILPAQLTVTGVLSSVFTLRRRTAPTTNPSGAGVIVVAPTDSAYPLPTVITTFNAPAVSPAGGTVTTFNEFVPQADEQKLSTLDAPTVAALFSNCGGQVIYRSADTPLARPMTLRAGETLEIQQSATAGVGNCRVLCIFTVG